MSKERDPLPKKSPPLEVEEFFRKRARRGKRDIFYNFLDNAGNAPPVEGDEIL